ncbi:MAG: hypothetical protein ACM3IJ_03470 [Candidatus Levyibacteriota bacterium]
MPGSYILKKDTIISTIIDDCPRAVELLTEYGLFCVSCFLNQFDTLETGAIIHRMTDDQINSMIKEINEQLKKESQPQK